MKIETKFMLRVVGEFQPYEFHTILSDEIPGLTVEDIIAGDARVKKLNLAAIENTFAIVELVRNISPDFDTVFASRSELIHNTEL